MKARSLLLGVLLTLTGCTPAALRAQAEIASALGHAVNLSGPTIAQLYEADCSSAIEASPRGEGRAALAACRSRWAPVWSSLEVLTAAQHAWIAALDAGDATDWPSLFAAACGVARVLAEAPPGAQIPLLTELCR